MTFGFQFTIETSLYFAAFEIHNSADLGRTDVVDASKVGLFVFSRFVQTPDLLNCGHGEFSIHD